MTSNIGAALGQFPSDATDQQLWMNQLIAELATITTEVNENAATPVTLQQATEPTQIEWEQAWYIQTGRPLPIRPSAMLLWHDTSTNSFGGVYGTVYGNGTVYRREHRAPRGATVVLETAQLGTEVSITNSLLQNNSVMPSVSFTLRQPSQLFMYFTLYAKLTAGSGTWGADFLLDSIKVGTQYYGVSADYGLMNAETTGPLHVYAHIPSVDAGDHTVQALFGYTGNPTTPPTIAIGGVLNTSTNKFGVRHLLVRAIAL